MSPALIVAGSDAMCVYDDGHSYCFSCNVQHQNKEQQQTKATKPVTKGGVVSPVDLNLGALTARGISMETCKSMGITRDSDMIDLLSLPVT